MTIYQYQYNTIFLCHETIINYIDIGCAKYIFLRYRGIQFCLAKVLKYENHFIMQYHNEYRVNITQIMTGIEGIGRSIWSPPQEFLLTEAQPRSIEIVGQAKLNLKGQIDSLLPEGPVIICFIIPLRRHSKKKNDYFNWKLTRSIMVLISLV